MMSFPKFDTFAYLSADPPTTPQASGLDALAHLGAVILPFEKGLATLTETEREHYEERAAIRQFDGGASREQAEREALCEVIELRRYRV